MTRFLALLLLGGLTAFGAAADQAGSQLSAVAPRYYDFTFTFTNATYGGGTVTGVVRGLHANGTSAAYSVQVTGSSFGEGQYVGSPFQNEWTLSNGAIQSVEFISLGQGNSPPAVTGHSLLISTIATQAEPFSAALSDVPNGAGIAQSGGTNLTFTVLRAYHNLPHQNLLAVPAGPQPDMIRTPEGRLAIPLN